MLGKITKQVGSTSLRAQLDHLKENRAPPHSLKIAGYTAGPFDSHKSTTPTRPLPYQDNRTNMIQTEQVTHTKMLMQNP